MSQPDKENRLENQVGRQDSREIQLNKKKKSSLQDLIKEKEAHLPVGKLKWSKEDEPQRDTNLDSDLNSSSDQQVNQREEAATIIDQINPAELKKEPFNTSADPQKSDNAPVQEDKEKMMEIKPLESDFDWENGKAEWNDLQKLRTNSLEDTLTPIDFKEYSIDPEPEEKEYKKESKKPVFVSENKISYSRFDDSDDQNLNEGDISNSAYRYSSFDDSNDVEEGKVKNEHSIGKKIAIWTFKILWLPILLIIVLIVSLMIGHTVIGDQPAGEIFDMKMWEHIYNLIYG